MSGSTPPAGTGFRVVVLSGPSGSGKSTIVNRLMRESPVRLYKAVSATTRPARTGEVQGQDYYFLTPDEFAARRANDEFLEFAEVHGSGYWYGTLKSELDKARSQGAWAFLEIDVQGALRVMEAYPDAVSIFLRTSSQEEYERRLRGRGTESEEVIRRRLKTAENELKHAERYRYQVVNDNLDDAVREIAGIFSQVESQSHVG